VLDGDIDFALERVTAAITAHAPLSLLSGPDSMPAVGFASRFSTNHSRTSSEIELRHALLPWT